MNNAFRTTTRGLVRALNAPSGLTYEDGLVIMRAVAERLAVSADHLVERNLDAILDPQIRAKVEAMLVSAKAVL